MHVHKKNLSVEESGLHLNVFVGICLARTNKFSMVKSLILHVNHVRVNNTNLFHPDQKSVGCTGWLEEKVNIQNLNQISM